MPRKTWSCDHTEHLTYSIGYLSTFSKPSKVMICTPCIEQINTTPEDPWGAGRSKAKAMEVACEKVDAKRNAEEVSKDSDPELWATREEIDG